MRWTIEKPTEPGWYWYRQYTDVEPDMVNVTYNMYHRLKVRMPGNAFKSRVSTIDGEWSGPIEQPEEVNHGTGRLQ